MWIHYLLVQSSFLCFLKVIFSLYVGTNSINLHLGSKRLLQCNMIFMVQGKFGDFPRNFLPENMTLSKRKGVPHKQGSKFSDFSLISDLFPTPRTILEISVNLKRFFFWRGGGRGIGVHWLKMALECTICNPRSQKISGGGPPDPEIGCFISGSFNKHVHTLQSAALCTFRPFGQNPFWSLTKSREIR